MLELLSRKMGYWRTSEYDVEEVNKTNDVSGGKEDREEDDETSGSVFQDLKKSENLDMKVKYQNTRVNESCSQKEVS